MLIVDAQVHIWGPDTPARPWPPGRAHEAQRPQPFTARDLLAEMDAAGVDRAVIVPPSWEGDRNDLALAAAAAHPDRFAVMGRLALDRPESRDMIAGWRRQTGMLGIRLTFNGAQRPWLTDGTADWIWPAAARAGVPIMMSVSGQLPAVGRIADRHPDARLVIDHMGRPPGSKDAAAFADLPDLLALARRPNVAVKASSAPSYSSEPYPFPNLHEPLHRIFDAFGPARTFWGTDLTRLPCSYREAITLFTEELPFLSARDKALVMGEAICAWLGWPLRA